MYANPSPPATTRATKCNRNGGRGQANARESVNSAFGTLRDMIPTEPLDRKLSKIETLRLAHSYIEHLSAVLCTGQLIAPCSMAYRRQSTTLQQHQHQHQPQQQPALQQRRTNICTFCVAGRSATMAGGGGKSAARVDGSGSSSGCGGGVCIAGTS